MFDDDSNGADFFPSITHDHASMIDIKDGLARLTTKRRTALLLHLQGYKQWEIGEAMGVSREAACGLVHQAKKDMCKFFKVC